MKFFCPQCSSPVESPGEASHAKCAHCGLDIDLSQLHTSAGQPFVPVVQNLSGQNLGPYHLQKVLGSGGMGTVYLGKDQRDKQSCALKVLFPQFSTQEQMLQRFQREAALLKDLNHPHIVRYIDQGHSEGQHYLVMEYVQGESLDQLLQRGPLSGKQAIEITAQICEALEAAHAQSIVHRDLKPANIILSPQGLKVLDFGIAHIGISEHSLTRTDAVIGSLNYMSPEQRSSGKAVDARSDLFSLGVILYRMLTGELPMGAFAPISRFRPKLGRGFDKLSRRLLNPSPELRPASATALLGELQGLGRGPHLPIKYRLAIAVSIVSILVYSLIYSLVPTAEAERIEPALPKVMNLQKDLGPSGKMKNFPKPKVAKIKEAASKEAAQKPPEKLQVQPEIKPEIKPEIQPEIKQKIKPKKKRPSEKKSSAKAKMKTKKHVPKSKKIIPKTLPQAPTKKFKE